jgi:hypothetical protein
MSSSMHFATMRSSLHFATMSLFLALRNHGLCLH